MKYNFTDLVTFSGKACPSFEGEKIYVSTGCLHTDLICKNETELVNYSDKPSRANLVAEPGDILFAKMQSTKKNIILSEETANYVYSTGFYAIRASKNLITNKCLYYLISSDIFLKEKDKNCSGATQKAITNEGLKKIQINIPSIEIQKNIEKQLDAISASIKHKETQLQKLDDLVKARFVEMFGNVTTNDKNWPTKPISSVAPARSPKIITTEGVWLLNLDMIEPQSGKVLNKLIVPKGKINVSTCSFDDKNVLYSKLRPYLNKVVLPDQEGYCTAELVPLRPNNELNREFLAALLRSRAFVDYINGKTAGAKMPRVSMGIFRQFECILPPIRLQERFSTFYKQVDKSKFALGNELAMGNFYIRLIYDRIMHGRVDLRMA